MQRDASGTLGPFVTLTLPPPTALSFCAAPKRALLRAGEVKDKCVVCPAHGTFFDLKTGEVVGEW